MQLILNLSLNFFLITIRLLPAFYFLSLGLAGLAVIITEDVFGIYAITFRPFVYSLLMLCLLWILSLDKLDWFNKYFWFWVRGDRPYQIIYQWLSLIVGVFGIACFASGLATVFIGADSQFSMFNIRDDIFFPAVAAFLISPIFITLHLHIKSGQGFSNKTKQNAVGAR
jgi:hypothetical protein